MKSAMVVVTAMIWDLGASFAYLDRNLALCREPEFIQNKITMVIGAGPTKEVPLLLGSRIQTVEDREAKECSGSSGLVIESMLI